MSARNRRWWQQDDQFHWFSVYLHDRGLDRQWRLATAVFTGFFAVIPMLMLASPWGPDNTVTRTIAVAAAVCGLLAAAVWVPRWPTRTQSLIFNAGCCLSIAAGSLALSTPYGALMACTMFAAVGGFLAYFHTLGWVVANFVVAMGCTAISATRLMFDIDDPPLVIASVLLVLGLNLGVPFGINMLVHSLHIDLRNSDRDPLTGLLNRRAFYGAMHELILERRGGLTAVNVTMIDIDDFKKLNDTRGHAAGDEALAGIGDVLLKHCAPGAVVGRLGGEEFVVADLGDDDCHAAAVELIREAVAALPVAITASLGSCTAVLEPGAVVEHPGFLDDLLRVADSAMYDSKRAGGNRVQHRCLDEV